MHAIEFDTRTAPPCLFAHCARFAIHDDHCDVLDNESAHAPKANEEMAYKKNVIVASCLICCVCILVMQVVQDASGKEECNGGSKYGTVPLWRSLSMPQAV